MTTLALDIKQIGQLTARASSTSKLREQTIAFRRYHHLVVSSWHELPFETRQALTSFLQVVEEHPARPQTTMQRIGLVLRLPGSIIKALWSGEDYVLQWAVACAMLLAALRERIDAQAIDDAAAWAKAVAADPGLEDAYRAGKATLDRGNFVGLDWAKQTTSTK